jgi:hypothetical protein
MSFPLDHAQVLSEHDDDLSKALPAFEARRAGDIRALIELMTFSAPYQYNQVRSTCRCALDDGCFSGCSSVPQVDLAVGRSRTSLDDIAQLIVCSFSSSVLCLPGTTPVRP